MYLSRVSRVSQLSGLPPPFKHREQRLPALPCSVDAGLAQSPALSLAEIPPDNAFSFTLRKKLCIMGFRLGYALAFRKCLHFVLFMFMA